MQMTLCPWPPFPGQVVDGDQQNVNPMLRLPLANNGGFTQTHALLPGSPAIDRVPANYAPATGRSPWDSKTAVSLLYSSAGASTRCASPGRRGRIRGGGDRHDHPGAYEAIRTTIQIVTLNGLRPAQPTSFTDNLVLRVEGEASFLAPPSTGIPCGSSVRSWRGRAFNESKIASQPVPDRRETAEDVGFSRTLTPLVSRALNSPSLLWVRERTRFAGEVAREVARSAGAAMIG